MHTLTNVHSWTSGLEVEFDAVNQIRNIASLPIVAGHVAVMPDVHVGKGATVGTVLPTLGAIIPATVGVDIGCFRGDTKVPLLDGSQATLLELSTRTMPFWVYSVDSNLRVTPGKAVCVKTREMANLLRVVVSGGDEVICTPDHQFMMNDGTYVEAQNLSFNDSLMPIYRRWQTRDGYESVNNGKGTSAQTHVMTWEALNGPVPEGFVVHHRSHIHFENQPENLELMSVSEHSSWHRSAGHSFDNSNSEFQNKRHVGIAARSADPEKRKQMEAVGTSNIKAYMKMRPEHFKQVVAANGKRGAPYLRTFNTSPRQCGDCDEVVKNPSALRWHKRREHGYNHKVISVTFLEERADVYCLQVESHHNFALSAGVFVHNCGMVAVRTALKAGDLPDSLAGARLAIEASIPVGFASHQKELNPTHEGPHGRDLRLRMVQLFERFENLSILAVLGKIDARRIFKQLGTLGGGNHFVELCLDEVGDVWIMLHSGSRNIGKTIGEAAIGMARESAHRDGIALPDKDLAWLNEGTVQFAQYVEALQWAQDYAALNRELMLFRTVRALAQVLGREPGMTLEVINCHHNYASVEEHFGSKVWITRKGAVSARAGQLGIIPGSMGAKSFIVRGKGNPLSYCSCSHGAGRRHSRGAAKRLFNLDDLAAQTLGVECRKDAGVLDEIPGAYKDIEAVMAAQADLVTVEHTLKQIMCIKG